MLWPDSARVIAVDTLEPGQRLRLIKFVGYGWSHERTQPAMRDQVAAAIAGARFEGWDGLVAAQRAMAEGEYELAARRLVNFANLRGATDNCTVVVARCT